MNAEADVRPRARARMVGALCIVAMLCACSERTPAVPAQAGKGAAPAAPTSPGIAPAGNAPSEAADKPDAPATPTPTSPGVVPARAAPSQADFEALVQRIDDDLRANKQLSDADRQRFARQFAQEFVDIAADWQSEEERKRRFQQEFTATWGSVEDVKARECASMRAQIDVLQRRADGTSSERLTEAERAALPDEIRRMTAQAEQVCR